MRVERKRRRRIYRRGAESAEGTRRGRGPGQGERRHNIQSINEKQEVVKKNNKWCGMNGIRAKKIRTIHNEERPHSSLGYRTLAA
jgi:hypothetical protein